METQTMIKFKCQRCKAAIQASDANIGKNVQCPTCGLKNVVPRPKVKVRKPIPPVFWAATGLVLAFGVLAWAVWPSGGKSSKKSDKNEVVKESRPDFDAKIRKRLEEDRVRLDEERARDIEEMKEDDVKRRRDEEIRRRQLEEEERQARETYERKQRERERREKKDTEDARKKREDDANKNRYE